MRGQCRYLPGFVPKGRAGNSVHKQRTLLHVDAMANSHHDADFSGNVARTKTDDYVKGRDSILSGLRHQR